MKPGSFAFRYKEPLPYMLLDTIGWQMTNSEDYGNDGQHRMDNGHVIFQYTLSGEGRMDINGQTYTLPEGTGFFVKIPSAHRYYYKNTSQDRKSWEFIWLNAKGNDVGMMWDRIIQKRGHVFHLDTQAEPISRFWDIYRAVSEEKLSESSELSSLLYRFIVAFLAPELRLYVGAESNNMISKAKSFMKANYTHPLSLEDIAAHCGISGAYLCRVFQKNELVSPLEYLRQRRIENAVTLLRSTELSVQEIGKRCGFHSPSYFGKVFRQYLGLSPREYRIQRMSYPFDTLFIE